jgi:hypothetical protein
MRLQDFAATRFNTFLVNAFLVKTFLVNAILVSAFLAITIAHSDANAAGVYKIIGPDGKVSFSDKPPADAATTDKLDIVRTPTEPLSSRTANETSVASTPNVYAAPKSGAKQAIAVGESKGQFARTADPDPATEKAIIGVLGYEDLVRQTETLCVRTLPTSFEKYSGAADSWRNRNGALVAQAHQVLAEQYNSPQRQSIESGIRAKNNASLAPITAASAASKINWCDSSSDAIKNGTMDVYNKTNLSTPLVKTRS